MKHVNLAASAQHCIWGKGVRTSRFLFLSQYFYCLRSPIVCLALIKAYLCRHPIMCLASIKTYLCRRPSGYCKCCGEVLRPFRLAFGCLVLGAPSGFHNVRCTALHKGVVFHSFLIANLTFLLNFAQEPLRGSKMCFSRCSKTASFLTRFLLQNYLFYSIVPKCQS